MQLKVSIVVGVPYPNPKVLVLSPEFRLPECYFNEGCFGTAIMLLDTLTGVQARNGPGTSGWVDLTLADVVEYNDSNSLTVVYSVVLPEIPNNLPIDYTWANLNELESSVATIATNALRKAC